MDGDVSCSMSSRDAGEGNLAQMSEVGLLAIQMG